MAEKTIGEIRFIETEDGFRIEFKGDKERMKKMGFMRGMGGMGAWRHRPWKHGPFGSFGPWTWDWSCWDSGFSQGDAEDKPPKNV